VNHRSRAPARNLAYVRNLAHALARDLDLALSRTRDRDLSHALTLTRDLTHALDLNHTLDRPHALDLAHTLALAHARAHAHAGDRAYALDPTRDSTCTLAIDRAHNCATELIRALDRARDSHFAARQEAVTGSGSSIPGRVPWGVLALATRVLPVGERPRYREEFHVEIVELPNHERFGYALRVLARAWELRRVLTGAVRNPDGSPARRAER
jgi:hypothetical protein